MQGRNGNYMTGWRRWFFILLLISLCFTGLLHAQEEPSFLPASFGEDIPGTLTQTAFFDHWTLNVRAGDILQVVMTGEDGLAPLVGILNPIRTLVAASSEGAVNGAVSVSYTIPEDGQYIIIATRAGNEFGTTEGSYRLRIDHLNPQPTPTPLEYELLLQPFACGDAEANPIVSIEFGRESFDAVSYSIRAYGFDGFDPVLRVQSVSDDTDTCITTFADARGDTITFPDGTAYTRTPDDLHATVQHILTEADFATGQLRLTFANLNGDQGRFAAVVGGFRIEPADDMDIFTIQAAPGVIDVGGAPLIYGVGINNRLDPTLLWVDQRCDDAGRRGCENVPSITGAGVVLNNGVAIEGDRFDAGVSISTLGAEDYYLVSFGGTTRGEYALLIYG